MALSAHPPASVRSGRSSGRRVAAFLAALALLALPLRALMACTMPAAAGVEVSGNGAGHGSDHGDHSEHGGQESDPSPESGHTACPDLSSCTAAAIPSEPPAIEMPTEPSTDLVGTAPLQVDAPHTAVEPPPPKR